MMADTGTVNPIVIPDVRVSALDEQSGSPMAALNTAPEIWPLSWTPHRTLVIHRSAHS